MFEIKLNIGLNNNSELARLVDGHFNDSNVKRACREIVTRLAASHQLDLSRVKWSIVGGEWAGIEEPTLVITGTSRRASQVYPVVAALARMMTQDCVAVTINGYGELVTGDGSFPGYKFDGAYFEGHNNEEVYSLCG